MKNCSLDQEEKKLYRWRWILGAWMMGKLLSFAALIPTTSLKTAPPDIRIKTFTLFCVVLFIPIIIFKIKKLRYKKLVSQSIGF